MGGTEESLLLLTLYFFGKSVRVGGGGPKAPSPPASPSLVYSGNYYHKILTLGSSNWGFICLLIPIISCSHIFFCYSTSFI